MTIPANTRLTINPEIRPGTGATDARLYNANFAITITSDVPIVAERSMYWGGKASPWGEGHTSPGLTAPALIWDLAEGRTGGAHEFFTYILLSNPQTTAADVTVTYLREAGVPIVRPYTVPATARSDDRRERRPRAGQSERRRARGRHQQHAGHRRALDVLERGRHLLVGRLQRHGHPCPLTTSQV